MSNFPASLGYAMPAEWAQHTATWLSWPHNTDTWPEGGKMEAVQYVYSDIVAALSTSEEVRINVAGAEMENRVKEILKKKGVSLVSVAFHHHVTQDAWCRDHGPIFVKNDQGTKAITDWGYNAWGGKYPPFDLDNQIPKKIADHYGYERFAADIILEGGSIEVDGKGTLLTTRACLLNKNRNPHLTQDQIELYLKNYLGIKRILWLEDGIVGDDTDGHIDDLTRFTDPYTLVTIVEKDTTDDNYHILKENSEQLKHFVNFEGNPYKIIDLPMPSPVWRDGERLPASYANFYIANKTVIVPVFGDKEDKNALEILQKCFPDRLVQGIYCRDLVWGLGTLHCVTQQEPA